MNMDGPFTPAESDFLPLAVAYLAHLISKRGGVAPSDVKLCDNIQRELERSAKAHERHDNPLISRRTYEEVHTRMKQAKPPLCAARPPDTGAKHTA